MTTGSLTILFEDPFWIGLFEVTDEDGLHVCKVTFGAEPTGQEIIEFVEKDLHKLEYSKGIEAKSLLETRKSPKRQLREARKQMMPRYRDEIATGPENAAGAEQNRTQAAVKSYA